MAWSAYHGQLAAENCRAVAPLSGADISRTVRESLSTRATKRIVPPLIQAAHYCICYGERKYQLTRT